MPDRAVLSVNTGSSSLKIAVFRGDPDRPEALVRGEIEGIGTAPRFSAKRGDGSALPGHRWPEGGAPDEADMIDWVLSWLQEHLDGASLAAAGHRIVHGGPDHWRPARIDEALLRELDALTPLAPLHQPHCLSPVRALFRLQPDLPQIACFDTAFHHDMPDVATRYPLPPEYAEIRRYGFHGLSYEHIAGILRGTEPRLAAGRVIVAHLGSGASLCAMAAGRSVETTMSFTALDGLVMGTRCGALDPGVLLYLQQERGLGVSAVEDLLYHHSGLLGLSGRSSDMRELLASGDDAAKAAVDLFCYRASLEAAAMACALGGVDGLVFTGGIGEHTPPVRQAICDRLAWLGVTIDKAANAAGSRSIGAPGSSVRVLVIPADEEAAIARHTLHLAGTRRTAT